MSGHRIVGMTITSERPPTALRGYPQAVNSVSVVAVPGTAFRRFFARLAAIGTSRTCEASSLVFVSRGRLALRRRQGKRCKNRPFAPHWRKRARGYVRREHGQRELIPG